MAEVNECHLTLEYLKAFAVGDVFVETGTYKGDGVKNALSHGFKTIHSIEIDENLYNQAVEMFKDNPEVKIWKGDSTEILAQIIEQHKGQEITFWLDAHRSGELQGGKHACPLIQELIHMAENYVHFSPHGMITKQIDKPYTVFIDDRRLMGSAEWGFVRENDVLQYLKKVNQNYKLVLLDGHVPQDIICATTKEV